MTGGAGYIGTHLCERLIQDGAKVYSLDNYFTGSKDNHIPQVTYIEGHTKDIFEKIDFAPDYIFHLGEYSRVEQSLQENFSLIFDLNKVGTEKVLEFALKNNSKFIYAGSSTKFGDGGLARDATPYAWTKATNTELVKNFGDWYGLDYAIVYFYNVFGGRERSGKYGTLISIFKQKYLDGVPLTVVQPGTQKRNFTHIKDIINGLYVVGLHGKGDDYGIGDERSYSILEIAELFNTKVEFLPERKGNRATSFIDTSKTKSLGWEIQNSVLDEIFAFITENKNDNILIQSTDNYRDGL